MGQKHAGKYLFKIILAGSPESQKTEILSGYTTGQFNSDTKMTIGVDFAVHYLDMLNPNASATLQIWDFGGEERFRSMLPSFCQGASGGLLFFDLLIPKTFYELDRWINIIRRNTQNIPIILCGTNYGKIKNPRQISPEFIEDIMLFIKSNKLNGYLSVDAATGFNVSAIFEQLATIMVK